VHHRGRQRSIPPSGLEVMRVRASRTFSAAPESVREARHLVHSVCRQAGVEEAESSVALLVSELVTNAVVHAGTPVRLDVSCAGGELTVGVTDGDARSPSPRSTRGEGGGFGLWLLDRQADRWGVRHHRCGKTVWFAVCCVPAEREAATADGGSFATATR
jgi:anti-sigma regulatory factor (Ser/Thr protein kinase)